MTTGEMETRLLALAAAGNVDGLQCLGYQLVDEVRRARSVATRLWRAERERDEAREVAQRLMAALNDASVNDYIRQWGENPGLLWERHSWLAADEPV